MENGKRPVYDLEGRTLRFSSNTYRLCKLVPRSIVNIEVLKQLVRSAGSIGANYIEANEALSKKDFLYRIKISRKEAKETGYWLQLLDLETEALKSTRDDLLSESIQLRKILSAIYSNSR